MNFASLDPFELYKAVASMDLYQEIYKYIKKQTGLKNPSKYMSPDEQKMILDFCGLVCDIVKDTEKRSKGKTNGLQEQTKD